MQYDLAKENEELKKDKEYLDNVNNKQIEVIIKLNEQIEKMKAQIKPLEDRICSLRRKNRSLENKIEKMKCCGNCKHFDIDDNERLNCVLQFIHCTNRDEWELAE